MFLASLPISFGGWGVRELSSIYVFGHLGVAPEIADRLFDPFVTTKPPNVAAGLGLSVVQSIARRHGGEVKHGNANQGGAEFCLVFPASQ